MQPSDGSDRGAGVGQRAQDRLAQRLLSIAALTLTALTGGAHAQQDALRIATRTVYAKDTPEWRQVREWLVQHPSTIDGERLGDPDQLSAVSLDCSVGMPAAACPGGASQG